MLSAKFGRFLDRPLTPFIRKIPIHPVVFTIAGFLLTVAAAYVIPRDLIFSGALVLAAGACDMLDGAAARILNKATQYGAFIDSMVDRYSDAFLFLSVAWHLANKGDHESAFLSIGALIGAFLVSYARARAEGIGISCCTGIMERPERIILLAIALFTGWFKPILWILLILTHFTVIQRVYYVWKAAKK